MRISAVIMCSGFGRRMGKNKLLMEFNGRRMFEHIIDTVKNCSFDKIVAVTSYDEIAEYSSEFTVIRNDGAEEGISASVRLGAEASSDCDAIMFFTADQPLLTSDIILKLISEFKKTGKITIPTVNGKNKNPVIFPIKYLDEIMKLKGEQGGKQIYKMHPKDICSVCFFDEKPFYDIDTIDDYRFIKNCLQK